MDKLAFRPCHLCRQDIEPGEPHWVHHTGPHDLDRVYCERCIVLSSHDAVLDARAQLHAWRRSRPVLPLLGPRSKPVQAERSEPSGKP